MRAQQDGYETPGSGLLNDQVCPPLRAMFADGECQDFDGFLDLGQTLEYSDESDYGGEAALVTDRNGDRFRVLVFAAMVVLCRRVADDFDPTRDLRLRTYQAPESADELIVEWAGSTPHRALIRTATGAFELARSGALVGWVEAERGPVLTWFDFNYEWLHLSWDRAIRPRNQPDHSSE